MSKNLKVRFGVPSNGWLPVHIETPAADIDFLASYVKDSLTELAEVLNLLCVGISDHIVIWELEPQQMVFSFIGGEENLLTFSIEERSNRSQTDRLQIQKHIEYTASAVLSVRFSGEPYVVSKRLPRQKGGLSSGEFHFLRQLSPN